MEFTVTLVGYFVDHILNFYSNPIRSMLKIFSRIQLSIGNINFIVNWWWFFSSSFHYLHPVSCGMNPFGYHFFFVWPFVMLSASIVHGLSIQLLICLVTTFLCVQLIICQKISCYGLVTTQFTCMNWDINFVRVLNAYFLMNHGWEFVILKTFNLFLVNL